jgi:putative transposase
MKNFLDRSHNIRISQILIHGMSGLIKEEGNFIKREEGNAIAFDSGYKKLLSDSNGNHYGVEVNDIYDRLSKKQRGSKSYKRLLRHKKNTINQVVNNINLDDTQTVVVEDLVQVKHKSKLSTKTMNKMQYWSYKQVLDKLEDRSELEGFYFIKVNPAYTSQTCSSCGTVDKSNRKGEVYSCACGLEIDADTNASINILRRGVYSPSSNLKDILL